MAANIGPALPPHLQKLREQQAEQENTETQPSPSVQGPELPPKLPEKQVSQTAAESDEDDDRQPPAPVSDYAGPALPPHLAAKRRQAAEQTTATQANKPANDDEESSDDDFGPVPLPEGVNPDDFDTKVADFEARAEAMRQQLQNPRQSKATAREEWMLTAPESFRKNFEVTNRTFRKSYSSTYTPPADPIAERKSAKVAEDIEQYNEFHRKTSLLDMHKAKRAKDAPVDTTERRPFDPEVDLKANPMSARRKDELIKRATGFESKFTRGKYR